MRPIRLKNNQMVLLDDEDYARLSRFHWIYRGERNDNPGYAIRHAKIGDKVKTVYLHREIMNPPFGYEVIFLNHDRLDCRRENLRVVTKEEARRHHRVRRDSKSGIKGVRFNPDGGTWSADIFRNGHCYHIGTYSTQEDAAEAYKEAVLRENPEWAQTPAPLVR